VPATQAPAPTNTPSPESATNTPVPAQTTGTGVHVVQRGENLFRIALRYGTTVQAIASANGIANPQQIYVGQRLVIPGADGQPAPAPQPGGTTHVVRPGENLFRIALRYNLNYHYLAQYNGITNPAKIRVGQVLRIPPH
jgi:putative chitinase